MLLALASLCLSKPRIMSLTRKAAIEKAYREGQGGGKVKGHVASLTPPSIMQYSRIKNVPQLIQTATNKAIDALFAPKSGSKFDLQA